MNEPYSFSRQARVGRAGEREVIAWLQRSGYEVEDVTADPQWRGRDVDLILTGGVTAEIKTDTHPPEALFVELDVDGRAGYVFKTRADVLLYYFSGYRKLLWLKPADLAHWTHEHKGEFRLIEVRSRRRDSEWVAKGIVVPVADLGGLVQEFDLTEEMAA